jgi:5-methyltetrahydropteroyltriglutamate--homocysteine methyltransferase
MMVELKFGRISEENYIEAIKEEISKVVKLQEELDIDVLVHGEPEVSSQFQSIA